mmetsp:Transcript_32412/g.48866  ORF Transcript_32412/g.48866 Transcript_32412/m.48866 type:complete len:211 (-) Transcript_32412:244-876(-)
MTKKVDAFKDQHSAMRISRIYLLQNPSRCESIDISSVEFTDPKSSTRARFSSLSRCPIKVSLSPPPALSSCSLIFAALQYVLKEASSNVANAKINIIVEGTRPSIAIETLPPAINAGKIINTAFFTSPHFPRRLRSDILIRSCPIQFPNTAILDNTEASFVVKFKIKIKIGKLRPPPPMPAVAATRQHPPTTSHAITSIISIGNRVLCKQ